MKYLDYISRTVKRYIKKWRIRNESALKIRMIVIYTADIEPRQTQPVLDVGCLRLQVEEAFLCEMDWEETERELAKKIKEHEPLTAEDQMRFIVLPLTHKGKQEKQECIRRCFRLAREVADVKVQTFILSGMLVFSDKVITKEDSKQIKEWIMLTKVGQLFEEEKLEAVKEVTKEAEKQRENTARKLLGRGFSQEEILEIVDGLTEGEIRKLKESL